MIVTFVDIVFVIFVAIVFFTFVDKLSITIIISSHTVTDSSEILFKYLLLSQIHVLRLYYIILFTRTILVTCASTFIIIPFDLHVVLLNLNF